MSDDMKLILYRLDELKEGQNRLRKDLRANSRDVDGRLQQVEGQVHHWKGMVTVISGAVALAVSWLWRALNGE